MLRTTGQSGSLKKTGSGTMSTSSCIKGFHTDPMCCGAAWRHSRVEPFEAGMGHLNGACRMKRAPGKKNGEAVRSFRRYFSAGPAKPSSITCVSGWPVTRTHSPEFRTIRKRRSVHRRLARTPSSPCALKILLSHAERTGRQAPNYSGR